MIVAYHTQHASGPAGSVSAGTEQLPVTTTVTKDVTHQI